MRANLAINMRRVFRSVPGSNSLYRLYSRTEIPRLLAGKKVWSLLDRRADQRHLMINVGGGYFARRHWRVLDFPSSWYTGLDGFIDYRVDLTADEAWPLPDGSVARFFSSHTLEHIPQEHCEHILAEMYRCLKRGGGARIVVPDFDMGYAAFGRGDESFFALYPGDSLEERFLDFFATHMKKRVPPGEVTQRFLAMSRDDFAEHFTRQVPRDSQREATGNHINWWNYDKLNALLRRVGFREVYRSHAQGSGFPEMRGPGRRTGFDSTHPELSLFVEAIKR